MPPSTPKPPARTTALDQTHHYGDGHDHGDPDDPEQRLPGVPESPSDRLPARPYRTPDADTAHAMSDADVVHAYDDAVDTDHPLTTRFWATEMRRRLVLRDQPGTGRHRIG